MVQTIGRNTNTNDTATVANEVQITVNTAVTALSANADRIYVAITILDKDAWIRFIPAATDASTRKGIYVKKNAVYEMPTDNIYIGEVSIINKKNGEKPKYLITEF